VEPAVGGKKRMSRHDAGKEKEGSAAAWEKLSSSYGVDSWGKKVARGAHLFRGGE
jgi:hypothetical protein